MSDTTSKDDELRNKVQALLHRVRTRALRDAPVYLSHINEVEQDMLQLIKQYGIQERIDEISPIPLQHGRHTTIRYTGGGKMQSIKDRHAELTALKDKENKTTPTPEGVFRPSREESLDD